MHFCYLLLSSILVLTSAVKFDSLLPEWNYSFQEATVLGKRQSGYHPTSGLCGSGSTCAEACGETYQMCPSNDLLLHCFDPSQGQVCCPNGSGYACDPGYYCAQDAVDKPFCCPNGMSLATCASLFTAVSLQLAHSTTTIIGSTYITPTITAVSTIFVTMSSTATLVGTPITCTSNISLSIISGARPSSSASSQQNGTSSSIVSFTGGANAVQNSRCSVVLALGINWIIAQWGF